MTLDAAVAKFNVGLVEPKIVRESADVRTVLDPASNLPVLIVDAQNQLSGIATPFDLL